MRGGPGEVQERTGQVNRDRIDAAAAVLDRHTRNPNGQHDGWWECRCGEPHTGLHLISALLGAGFEIA
jgi:hypothetical protein